MQGRPVLGVGATVRRATNLAAPKSIPTFKPVPFKQEKFLSLKSRSAETYFNARQQILNRSALITDQVKKQRADDISGEEVNKDVNQHSFQVEMASPLSTHMSNEIEAWNRKVNNIEAQQGFVMADELVYEAISRNVQWGATPYVLDWLRKAARERRIPFPARILHELSLFIDSMLSSVPLSTSSLLVSPDVITGELPSSSLHIGDDDEQRAARGEFVNSTPYVRHIFTERFAPLWQCLANLGFLPGAVRNIGSASEAVDSIEGEENSEDWTQILLSGDDAEEGSNPKTLIAVQRVIDCVCVASSGEGDTALRVVSKLLLSLAHCAAEAKEAHILLELQLVFCVLFVEQRSGSASSGARHLRRHPWCTGSPEDEEILDRFACDFISATYYGRQAYRGEMELNACLAAHMCTDPANPAAELEPDAQEEELPPGESEEREGEGEGEEERGEEGGEDEQTSRERADKSFADSARGPAAPSLRRCVDEVLAGLFRGELAVLAGAAPYFAMALRDARLLPRAAAPFSRGEMEWMRRHCDACASAAAGDAAPAESLAALLSAKGPLANGLEATAEELERQCLLALASGTVVAVAAKGATLAERKSVAGKAAVELLRLSGDAGMMVYTYALIALLLPRDATDHLQSIAAKVMEQPLDFGNAYGVLLLVLVRAGLWADVGRLLRKLVANDDANSISSVLVDQRMWAQIFCEARDAGEAELCVLMRQNREKLFY